MSAAAAGYPPVSGGWPSLYLTLAREAATRLAHALTGGTK